MNTSGLFEAYISGTLAYYRHEFGMRADAPARPERCSYIFPRHIMVELLKQPGTMFAVSFLDNWHKHEFDFFEKRIYNIKGDEFFLWNPWLKMGIEAPGGWLVDVFLFPEEKRRGQTARLVTFLKFEDWPELEYHDSEGKLFNYHVATKGATCQQSSALTPEKVAASLS